MNYIKEPEIKELIELALKEDIGIRDITTEMVIPKRICAKAVIIAKQDLVVCGISLAGLVFKTFDTKLKFKANVKDGDSVKKGKILALISGEARSILSAERVALNFLSLLCAISTKTRKLNCAVKPYKTKILDTRKTIPGLRLLEKYAVRIGGGYNHRISLDEMILVKDNHIMIIGGIEKLTGFSRKYKVEIEVKSLKELKEALRLNPDIIMLDNMSSSAMRKAVKARNKFNTKKRPKLEASGGITLNNIEKAASTGVDFISLGNLTNSIESPDISLEIIKN